MGLSWVGKGASWGSTLGCRAALWSSPQRAGLETPALSIPEFRAYLAVIFEQTNK